MEEKAVKTSQQIPQRSVMEEKAVKTAFMSAFYPSLALGVKLRDITPYPW
jgi:hypothetical protein